MEQIYQDIEQVSGDGGYDTFDCEDASTKCAVRGASPTGEGIALPGALATIPPRSSAKIQSNGQRQDPSHPKDENLRRVHQVGRQP